MGHPGQCRESLISEPAGAVFIPESSFFQHDFAFAAEIAVADVEIAKAFRFEIDHQRQGFRGHVLVVYGDVAVREGVDTPSARVHQLGVLLRSEVLRTLEHHVLEQMRETGVAGLIPGTHLDPDLERHHRRAMIFEQIDFESIGKQRLAKTLNGVADLALC